MKKVCLVLIFAGMTSLEAAYRNRPFPQQRVSSSEAAAAFASLKKQTAPSLSADVQAAIKFYDDISEQKRYTGVCQFDGAVRDRHVAVLERELGIQPGNAEISNYLGYLKKFNS